MIAGAPLIIGPDQRAALQALIERAERAPINVVPLRTLGHFGRRAHIDRMMREFTVRIPGIWDFVVTFTHEIGHPIGLCRHISISIERPGRVPNPEAVWMIAQDMGFTGQMSDCAFWTEDIGAGERAINLLQPLAPVLPPVAA